jgi:LuxR family maltose regulon positive regulatory protein
LHVFTSLIYGWVLLVTGNQTKSDKIINELEDITKSKDVPPYLVHLFLAWKIDEFIRQEKFESAYKIIESLDLSSDKDIDFANELVYISFARYLISQFRIDEAEKVLSQIHPLAESGNHIERLLEIKNLYSILYKTTGERDKALLYLSESIKLAEKENLLMFFILEGNSIYDLLKELYKKQTTIKDKISVKFLKRIILAIEKRETRSNDPSSEILSKREIDVLKLIAKNHTNQQIADTLFISLNTVKTHIKNIHLKLDVYDRAAAVTKVKELGII